MYRSIALSARKAASEVERNNTSGRNTPRAGQRPRRLWLRGLILGFLIGDSRSTSLRPGRRWTQCPKPRQRRNKNSLGRQAEFRDLRTCGPPHMASMIETAVTLSQVHARDPLVEHSRQSRNRRASSFSGQSPSRPRSSPKPNRLFSLRAPPPTKTIPKSLSPPFHQSTIINSSTAPRICAPIAR